MLLCVPIVHLFIIVVVFHCTCKHMHMHVDMHVHRHAHVCVHIPTHVRTQLLTYPFFS